jgi:hypothetical protein
LREEKRSGLNTPLPLGGAGGRGAAGGAADAVHSGGGQRRRRDSGGRDSGGGQRRRRDSGGRDSGGAAALLLLPPPRSGASGDARAPRVGCDASAPGAPRSATQAQRRCARRRVPAGS